MFLKCRISYVESKITSTQFTFEYNLKIYLHNKNLILAFLKGRRTAQLLEKKNILASQREKNTILEKKHPDFSFLKGEEHRF